MPRNYIPKYQRGKYNKDESSSSSSVTLKKEDLTQIKELREAVFFFKQSVKENFIGSRPRSKVINSLQNLIDCFDKHIKRDGETALTRTSNQIQEYFSTRFPVMDEQAINHYSTELASILENGGPTQNNNQ